MNKAYKQFILPIITAAIWGAAFLAQGNLSQNFPAFFVSATRCGIGFLTLLIICLIIDKLPSKFSKAKEERKAKSFTKSKKAKKYLIWASITCGISLFIAMNIQQLGIEGTLPSEAAFITAMYMIFVPIFSLFLGKKIGLNVWVSVVISLFGLAFICKIQGFSVNKYYVYLLISAVFFAIQIMLVDFYINFIDPIELSCGQFLVCAILSGISSILTETVDWSIISIAIFPFIYLGVFSSAIGYTLQIISQKWGNPSVVTLILSTESVFALIFNVILCLCLGLGVQETPLQFLGCALMLVAIFISQIEFKRKK